MTTNELYEKLVRAANNQLEETPEAGFKTSREWEKHFGKSEFTILRLIKKLRKQNKVVEKMYVRKWATGMRPIRHYKFII